MYFGFFCIILHFTQRIEFVVFIKSVCFGTLICVENSHFNEYSVNFAFFCIVIQLMLKFGILYLQSLILQRDAMDDQNKKE